MLMNVSEAAGRRLFEEGWSIWFSRCPTDLREEGGGSRVECGGAEPLQRFSYDRGGYPPVRVVLVARVDRHLSSLRAYENSELNPIYQPISQELKFRGCM